MTEPPPRIVVVARNDVGRIDGKLGDALKHIFRVGTFREVGLQLVVDGKVWGKYENIIEAMSHMKVADKRSHQPRLANARRQGKAQDGKSRSKSTIDGYSFPIKEIAWARSMDLSGCINSMMRDNISRESRWGGRKLKRLAIEWTFRFMTAFSFSAFAFR